MKGCNFVAIPTKFVFKIYKDLERISIDTILHKQIIGSLIYLIRIRSKIIDIASIISKYVEHPTKFHLRVAKGLFCCCVQKVLINYKILNII